MSGEGASRARESEYVTVTAKGDRFDAQCSKCGMGMDVGEWMGPIPGRVMIDQFVKQHAHKRKGKTS